MHTQKTYKQTKLSDIVIKPPNAYNRLYGFVGFITISENKIKKI
jgi:hypothetical protein